MVLKANLGKTKARDLLPHSFFESLRSLLDRHPFTNMGWLSLVKRGIVRHSEYLWLCSLEAELETGTLMPAVYWRNALRRMGVREVVSGRGRC